MACRTLLKPAKPVTNNLSSLVFFPFPSKRVARHLKMLGSFSSFEYVLLGPHFLCEEDAACLAAAGTR